MKIIVLLLLFLSFSGMAWAVVSGQDAINFVSLRNNLLYENETTEILPSVEARHAGQPYWLVSVVSGENLNALIPVSAKDPIGIAKTPAEKRELVRLGFVLRNYALLKDSLVKQDQWVFTSSNQRFFQQLGQEADNERFDLSTARSELADYPDLQSGIDLLVEKLQGLKDSSELLAEKTREVIDSESSYLKKPDTNGLSLFREGFDGVIEEFRSSQNILSSYLSELDKVKQGIAQTDLSIDTKRSLGNLLSVPTGFQRMPSLAGNALVFGEKLDEVFSNAIARRDGMLANLDTRVQRNNAYQAMYASSQEIIDKTSGNYSTLKEAVESIFSAELESLWKDRSGLAKLREDWKKAESYYNAGNYSLAEQFAKSSTTSALKIYKSGFVEQPEQGANTALLINGIIALVILVIIIYIARNRKKLLSIVSEPMKGNEYE